MNLYKNIFDVLWNQFNENGVPKHHFYFNVTSDFAIQKFQIKSFEIIWKWNIYGIFNKHLHNNIIQDCFGSYKFKKKKSTYKSWS
jgi:hypothetical protein